MQIKSDETFRGPEGPQGPPGEPAKIDIDAIADAVLQRLPDITVNTIDGGAIKQSVKLKLSGSEDDRTLNLNHHYNTAK